MRIDTIQNEPINPNEYYQVRGTVEYEPGQRYIKQYCDDFSVRRDARAFLASAYGLPEDASVWACADSQQVGAAA